MRPLLERPRPPHAFKVLAALAVLCVLGPAIPAAHSAEPGLTNATPPAVAGTNPATLAPTNVVPAVTTNGAPTNVTQAVTLDLAWVDAQQEQLEQNTGSDEKSRARLEKLYQDCRSSLNATATSAAGRDRFAALREGIPDRLEQLKALAESEPTLDDTTSGEGDLKSLEAELTRFEAELSASQSRLRDLKATPQERTDRLIEIARVLAEGQGQLEELKTSVKVEGTSPGSAELTTAVEAARTLQTRALEASLEALKEEQLYYEGARELLSVEVEQAAREVEQAKARVDRWRQKVTERREGTIDQDLSS